MKYNFYKTMLILSLFILCIVCTTTTANGQPWSGIRHFVIPNSPNIQGIDNKGDNTPDLWLTNFYLTGSIGKLHIGSQACSGATYSEWVPAYTGTPKTFDPFKIVSGTYKLKLPNGGPTGQLYQTLSAVSPWLPSKTITTILTSFSSIVSRAFFTMPTAKHIGMLMNGIGGSPSYFWIWDPTASGLSNPWDIQRSTIDDPSLWISNQSTQQAIYEFIPSTSVIRRWDISPIKLNVFYVNKIGKVNYVWVAGTDTLGNDCIGVLLSSGKYYYWKLTGGPRAMRSITFTGALTRTNTQCQVWLVNRYDPAVTILSPKSLFKGNADFVCDVAQGFENGSGVYFPGPELPSTPILVTQEQGDTTIMNVFSANHASPQTVIPKITTKKQFTMFSLTVDTIGALQRDYRIGDSCYAVGSLT